MRIILVMALLFTGQAFGFWLYPFKGQTAKWRKSKPKSKTSPLSKKQKAPEPSWGKFIKQIDYIKEDRTIIEPRNRGRGMIISQKERIPSQENYKKTLSYVVFKNDGKCVVQKSNKQCIFIWGRLLLPKWKKSLKLLEFSNNSDINGKPTHISFYKISVRYNQIKSYALYENKLQKLKRKSKKSNYGAVSLDYIKSGTESVELRIGLHRLSDSNLLKNKIMWSIDGAKYVVIPEDRFFHNKATLNPELSKHLYKQTTVNKKLFTNRFKSRVPISGKKDITNLNTATGTFHCVFTTLGQKVADRVRDHLELFYSDLDYLYSWKRSNRYKSSPPLPFFNSDKIEGCFGLSSDPSSNAKVAVFVFANKEERKAFGADSRYCVVLGKSGRLSVEKLQKTATNVFTDKYLPKCFHNLKTGLPRFLSKWDVSLGIKENLDYNRHMFNLIKAMQYYDFNISESGPTEYDSTDFTSMNPTYGIRDMYKFHGKKKIKTISFLTAYMYLEADEYILPFRAGKGMKNSVFIQLSGISRDISNKYRKDLEYYEFDTFKLNLNEKYGSKLKLVRKRPDPTKKRKMRCAKIMSTSEYFMHFRVWILKQNSLSMVWKHLVANDGNSGINPPWEKPTEEHLKLVKSSASNIPFVYVKEYR